MCRQATSSLRKRHHRQYSLLHTQAMWYSLLLLGYKPVQHVAVLNTVGNCNTMGSIIILYYNIIILWDHHRICSPSLTETLLYGTCLQLLRFPRHLVAPCSGSKRCILLGFLQACGLGCINFALHNVQLSEIALCEIWRSGVSSKLHSDQAMTQRTLLLGISLHVKQNLVVYVLNDMASYYTHNVMRTAHISGPLHLVSPHETKTSAESGTR